MSSKANNAMEHLIESRDEDKAFIYDHAFRNDYASLIRK